MEFQIDFSITYYNLKNISIKAGLVLHLPDEFILVGFILILWNHLLSVFTFILINHITQQLNIIAIVGCDLNFEPDLGIEIQVIK